MLISSCFKICESSEELMREIYN